MKVQISILIFVALLVSMTNTIWSAESSGPYLYQSLSQPTYKKTFNKLFIDQQNIEPWLKGYINNRNGVDRPSEIRMVGNKKYELYGICQPHNCPGNYLYILFEPGGSHAWAIFTKDNRILRFFGNPNKEQQAALESAANE